MTQEAAGFPSLLVAEVLKLSLPAIHHTHGHKLSSASAARNFCTGQISIPLATL
jgi:hypothetical protein